MYTQVDVCPADALEQTSETVSFLERLAQGSLEEVWLEEVYGQERGGRVSLFALQLDKLWSFVQKKENKCWVWLALNPCNRQIVAFHVGGRGIEDAQKLYENIPAVFKQTTGFFSDYWQAYQTVLDPDQHWAVGKDSGLTASIEHFNCTLRQRAARLVRKTLSFSKSFDNHVGAIKYFICHYNLQRAALHL